MNDSRSVQDALTRQRDEERRGALRALLMRPLLRSDARGFVNVRRHIDYLRDWFAREAGWRLHLDRDCARLYKRPADPDDASRGAADSQGREFDRRRYTVFCLACAVLDRADPQITLRTLGEKLLLLAGDPDLIDAGFTFTLEANHERRELVAVCRYLLDLGVLVRVAGDEDGFVQQSGDALYDIQRRVLAALLAVTRGPSSLPADAVAQPLPQRIAAFSEEFAPDSDEGRRSAARHQLARRLLDDPVVYFDDLHDDAHAYLQNQRGPLAARLAEATGLVAEQRAEGVALIDPDGELTDIALPADGTAAHITLLVAEHLSQPLREHGDRHAAMAEIGIGEVADFIRAAATRFGRYWNKAAREPGAERELARDALGRLAQLRLIRCSEQRIVPLPALARFALGDTTVKGADGARETVQGGLFG
jgi:uncharacterized protein (TIGR02678 family)